MKIKIALLLLPLLFCSGSLPAQEAASRIYTNKDGSTLTYPKPGFWRNIGSGPSDCGLFIKESFRKDNLPWLVAIGASTVLLIHYDEKINSATRRAGRKLGISSKDRTKTYLKIGGVSAFRGPSDLGSAMYFLGDGWITIGLSGYFATYGWLKNDWRAAQTGHQLAEGLLVTGFTTQVIKRVTGRETPRAATAKRGVWRMFPSFKDYHTRRSRYDAVPSGHMATGMMAITVIAENYPDKKYVKPLGYALLTAMGFQMVNNGVHWASDYPLGLAVGYGVGKAIAAGGKTAAKRSGPAAPTALNFAPYLSPEGAAGASLAYKF